MILGHFDCPYCGGTKSVQSRKYNIGKLTFYGMECTDRGCPSSSTRERNHFDVYNKWHRQTIFIPQLVLDYEAEIVE